MATVTWQLAVSFGAANTGHTGAVSYKITDQGGTIRQAFTTTGVTENADVPGAYSAYPVLNTTWLYPLTVAWKDTTAGAQAIDTVTLGALLSTIALPAAAAAGAGGLVTGNASDQVDIDMAQAVPSSPTQGSIGDDLLAAEAEGFGKWTLVGTTLTIYRHDGTTVARVFTLDSGTAPTQRA